MQLTVIPVVLGTLRTIPKDLERKLKELEIGGRIGKIRITALLRSARILRKVLETGEDFFTERPLANAGRVRKTRKEFDNNDER